MTELIFEKTVLMLAETVGISAPAATATKPAISAYSIKSCPCLSFQIFIAITACVKRFIIPLFPPRVPNVSDADSASSRLTPMVVPRNWVYDLDWLQDYLRLRLILDIAGR